MKCLFLLPLLIIFLTGCAGSPTSAITASKIETSTALPATKTPIPTNTIEPTPTKDPGIPEGYIKDSTENYTIVIDGITVIWDTDRNSGYSLMFDNFLIDERPAIEGRLPDTLGLKVFIDTAIVNWNKVTVTHPENMNPTAMDGSGPKQPMNGSGLVYNFIGDLMVRNGMIKDKLGFSTDQWYELGGYTRYYNTLEGPQTLILKDGYTTIVHIRADYEALNADMANNKFSDVVGSTNLGSPSIRYMVKISSDADGNTFVEIAPNIIDALQWSDNRIIEMYLLGFSNALSNPNDPVIPKAAGFSSDVAYNNKAYPYFVFTREE